MGGFALKGVDGYLRAGMPWPFQNGETKLFESTVCLHGVLAQDTFAYPLVLVP